MSPSITALIADDEEAPREQLRAALARLWPELNIVAASANGLSLRQPSALLPEKDSVVGEPIENNRRPPRDDGRIQRRIGIDHVRRPPASAGLSLTQNCDLGGEFGRRGCLGR